MQLTGIAVSNGHMLAVWVQLLDNKQWKKLNYNYVFSSRRAFASDHLMKSWKPCLCSLPPDGSDPTLSAQTLKEARLWRGELGSIVDTPRYTSENRRNSDPSHQRRLEGGGFGWHRALKPRPQRSIRQGMLPPLLEVAWISGCGRKGFWRLCCFLCSCRGILDFIIQHLWKALPVPPWWESDARKRCGWAHMRHQHGAVCKTHY